MFVVQAWKLGLFSLRFGPFEVQGCRFPGVCRMFAVWGLWFGLKRVGAARYFFPNWRRARLHFCAPYVHSPPEGRQAWAIHIPQKHTVGLSAGATRRLKHSSGAGVARR